MTTTNGQIGSALITLTVYDGAGASAVRTFTVRVNSPPTLTQNNTLTLDQRTTAVITAAELSANDDTSPANQIFFETVAPPQWWAASQWNIVLKRRPNGCSTSAPESIYQARHYRFKGDVY